MHGILVLWSFVAFKKNKTDLGELRALRFVNRKKKKVTEEKVQMLLLTEKQSQTRMTDFNTSMY